MFTFSSIISFSQTEKNFEMSVEEFPIYKGCEKQKDKRKCFQKKINALFSKSFRNFEFNPNEFKPGIEKINILFTITKYGFIDSIEVIATHPKIKEEALKTIRKIPKCAPGTHNKTPIDVKYSLPLAIKVQLKTQSTSAATRKTPWTSSTTRKY